MASKHSSSSHTLLTRNRNDHSHSSTQNQRGGTGTVPPQPLLRAQQQQPSSPPLPPPLLPPIPSIPNPGPSFPSPGLLTRAVPLDHRLDIAPSPSPPPHLYLQHQPQHHRLIPRLSTAPTIRESTSTFVTSPLTTINDESDEHPSFTNTTHSPPLPPPPPTAVDYHYPDQPSICPSDLSSIPEPDFHEHHLIDHLISPDLLNSLDMSPTPPPPPPKKRERTSNDTTASGTIHNTTAMSTNRPTKKEKPAPVTAIYRGSPDDLVLYRGGSDSYRPSTASMAALPPQTAINRALGAGPMSPIGIQPPSTIAPSYSLSHATETSLMKKKHNRLRDLCRERALLMPGRELTKRDMVQALLRWRELNVKEANTQIFSENEDSVMSSSSYETDDHTSFSLTAETSIEDSIDPQLCGPELNPGVYNLRPRPGVRDVTDHQQTIRTSTIQHRKGLAQQFAGGQTPQTQLANFFAATGLNHKEAAAQQVGSPQEANSPKDSEVMSHPPMIPLLDDPARNSKRRSIRLVGTKVPSLGPISKITMSSITVGGSGPTSMLEPGTMRVVEPNKTARAVQQPGTVTMHSNKPPSPPASTETEGGDMRDLEESNQQEPNATSAEDLDVLLDLEDLKLADKEIPPEKLVEYDEQDETREQKVGSGSFKDVYMGRYRNFRVAICDLRGRLTDMDIKELGLLRDLRHPNIVRFIGVSVGGNVPCTIVTELCRNGDLYDYIRKIPCPSFVQILAMMLDAARGVEYLHLRTPSIIHRDLKSPNVLITANGSAKITDFGLARVKRDVMSMCATTCGTLNWQAPELWVAHPAYNHSIDVYALGLVFWEILCWSFKDKTYPFQGMNEHAIFAEVGKNRLRPSTSMIRRKWGRDIVGMIEKMWADDPNERPTMPEVVRGLK